MGREQQPDQVVSGLLLTLFGQCDAPPGDGADPALHWRVQTGVSRHASVLHNRLLRASAARRGVDRVSGPRRRGGTNQLTLPTAADEHRPWSWRSIGA